MNFNPLASVTKPAITNFGALSVNMRALRTGLLGFMAVGSLTAVGAMPAFAGVTTTGYSTITPGFSGQITYNFDSGTLPSTQLDSTVANIPLFDTSTGYSLTAASVTITGTEFLSGSITNATNTSGIVTPETVTGSANAQLIFTFSSGNPSLNTILSSLGGIIDRTDSDSVELTPGQTATLTATTFGTDLTQTNSIGSSLSPLTAFETNGAGVLDFEDSVSPQLGTETNGPSGSVVEAAQNLGDLKIAVTYDYTVPNQTQSVPEPASSALVGFGVAMIGFIRRRRR